MLDGLLEGFSCPYSFKPDLLNILAREQFVAVIDLLLTRFEEVFVGQGEGVSEAVRRLIAESPSNFEVFWSPAIGYARAALQARNSDLALNAVAHLLLHSAVNGYKSDWSLRFNVPTELLCGSLALKHCSALSCVSATVQPSRLTMFSQNSSFTLDLNDKSIESGVTDSELCVRLPVGGTSKHQVLLLCEGTAGEFARSYDTPVCKQVTQHHIEAVSGALNLLATVVPHYYNWVMAITRRLVLVQAPPNQVASGTIEGHCGMYFVSDTDDLLLMSEMLVHESSHQYFNLLALLDNSVQANHVTEYYSPFPRRMRNLDRILIAYHAFANVAVLYEELKAQGHYERHLLANRNLLRDVKQIEDILKKDREYLTEVGKGMFDPLLARREALCAVAA